MCSSISFATQKYNVLLDGIPYSNKRLLSYVIIERFSAFNIFSSIKVLLYGFVMKG